MSLPAIYAELLQKVKHYGFPKLTIERLQQLYNKYNASSVDVCRYCHGLAQAGDEIWKLSAYETIVAKDIVLSQAAAAEERRRSQQKNRAQHGDNLSSSLIGIPFSVKANIAVASQPITAGSRILGAFKSDPNCSMEVPVNPIGYHADVTSILLRDCHAVLIGTNTMDEFGMGSLGTHVASRRDPPRNPIPFLRAHGSSRSKGSNWTDTDILQLMQLPTDAIYELHADLLTTTGSSAECAEEHDMYASGGSSCGSAIAVSHGSSIFSLGSDTGGSIRLPATYCHSVGFKPSYGILSRHGLVSYASSLDTIGILASSVLGVATTYQCLLEGMERHHLVRDSTQSTASTEYLADIRSVVSTCNIDSFESPPSEAPMTSILPTSKQLEGLRIGIPAAFSVAECSPAVRQTWLQGARWLHQHGATIEIVSERQIVPETLQKSLSAYYILVCAEASSNLSRYDGLRFGATFGGIPNDCEKQLLDDGDGDISLLEQQYAASRTEHFGNEVIRRLLCGTFVLSSGRFHTHYEKAAKLRSLLSQQFQNTLRSGSYFGSNDVMSSEKYDLLLIPTTIFPPPKVHGVNVNPTEMFANDIMTVPISLVGYPAISVSIHGSNWSEDDSLPPFQIGLQLVGPKHGEYNVLRAAVVLQELDCYRP